MLQSIIVDDERHVRETLAGMLGEYCSDVTVVAEAANLDAGRRAIVAHRPDLVFLDVEMPGGSGFDLLAAFGHIDFGVIFITAYDRYAIRAIKLSALDYLLKPVDPLELERAVAKAAAQRGANARADDLPPGDRRPLDVDHQSGRIAVPTEAGFEFVTVRDVVRCKAEGNYTRLFLVDGRRLLSSRTLGDFESVLAACGFMRVHHSHLVNLGHVRRYTKGRGGILHMADGAEVGVSVRRRDAFLENVVKI